MAPSTPISSTNQSPTATSSASRRRRVRCGLRSAAAAIAAAGAAIALVLQGADEPARRGLGELEADGVAAGAVADQGDELGALLADAVALQQLELRVPAVFAAGDAGGSAGELGAQRGGRRGDLG